MRNAAVAELLEIAKADSRVVLLTADLGFGVLDEFAQVLPDQLINVGVAEQAMIGVATGMAEGGMLPYCYSIATFAFLRPFEFIRNGPVGVTPNFDRRQSDTGASLCASILVVRQRHRRAGVCPVPFATISNRMDSEIQRETTLNDVEGFADKLEQAAERMFATASIWNRAPAKAGDPKIVAMLPASFFVRAPPSRPRGICAGSRPDRRSA